MSYEVPTAHKQQYNDNITHLLQQQGTKLRSCVRDETQQGKRESHDRIGPTEAQELEGRHSDTPLTSTPHDRRWVTATPAVFNDLVDEADKLRTITDPTNPYAQNAVFALGRRYDRLIINAADGLAYYGEHGTDSVALPASQYIDVDYVESGSPAATGLTIGKLRRAREMFDNAEVDEDEDQFIAVTGTQVNDLLRTTEVTSADYNTVRALVAGKINEFMGFKFKRISNKILKKIGANRRVVAWPKSGLLLSRLQDITTRIDERRDKNYSTQVYARNDAGAVRMEEEKVIVIDCLES